MNNYCNVFDKASSSTKKNETFALATITKCSGSTPGRVGNMMLVYKDGSIVGTVGGGNLEHKVIEGAKQCINNLENQVLSFQLNEKGSLSMICGGSTEVFIQVFKAEDELILVGGGHIAESLYSLARFLDFKVTVFEDREEFGNRERFPEAEIILGDYGKCLSEYPIGDRSFIVIVTRGHRFDEISLKTVLGRGAAYLGMIGSKNKVLTTKTNLLNEGIESYYLDEVFAPIGINIGGTSPKEIAFSIMSEIMVVKNKGKLEHLRNSSVVQS